MNDAELEKILKSAPPPDRPAEFWEKLPGRITTRIHWRSARAESAPEVRRPVAALRWVLAAATCVFVATVLITQRQPTLPALPPQELQLAQAQKYLQEIEALFPNQVQAIVFDQSGPHLVLAEKADVPDSTPLYLNICGPEGCRQFVTFSGQRINVGGDDCDVLLNAAGEILLVGEHGVWSSDARQRQMGKYRIEAHRMQSS